MTDQHETSPILDSTGDDEPAVDATETQAAAEGAEPSALAEVNDAAEMTAAIDLDETVVSTESAPAVADSTAPDTAEPDAEPDGADTSPATAEPDTTEDAIDTSDATEPDTSEPAAAEPAAAEPDAAEPDAAEPAADESDAPPAEPPAAAEDHDDASAAEEPPPAVEPPAPPATVAALLARTLRAAGVRSAFTVPGESFLPLIDALIHAGIRVVTTRHEGGAAFMAAAQAQLTGRPALCVGTRAVGAANLAIGIHAARADSAPVVAIVGGVVRSLQGREAFQEADFVTTIGGLATWAAAIDDPAAAASTLNRALQEALEGRPGPVLLSIPEDVLGAAPPAAGSPESVRPSAARPADAEVRAVLQLLASAERPVILAGGGVLRARTSSDLVRLAELLHVPVMAAWRRGDVVPNEHPLYLGMTGLAAPATVQERLAGADAILVLGCRLSEIASFGYRVPSAEQAWAHVDLEPRTSEAAGLPAPTIAVQADARSFLRAAIARLRRGVLDARLVDVRRAANEADRTAWEAAAVVDESPWDGPGVHPGRVITTLRRVLPDDAILTTDAGNFAGWAARGFRFRKPGTFLGPTSGAMGYGLPAAIAAALVHRDRPVVALAGDGGFAMSMAELETAVRERIRVVVIVFDNQRYGTIRMHQDRAGTEAVATDLGPIDFAAIARACGARGVRVDSDDAFEAALRQALAVAERPSVIQLSVDRRWVSVDDIPVREDGPAAAG